MSSTRYQLRPTSSAVSPTTIALGILLCALTVAPRTGAAAPIIQPGFSSETIHVKFQEGTNVELPHLVLAPDLSHAVVGIYRLFSLPKQKLNEIRARGMSRSGKTVSDLNLWFQIALQPGTDTAAFLDDLKRLQSVEIAEAAPLPQPMVAITPDFTGNQGYLDAAPGGIDARFAWTIPGGDGSEIKIYDVEYSWNQTHEDLSKASEISLLLDSGDSAVDPFDDHNHGTAVLGEIGADNDTKGVTGISWGAKLGLAPANTANLGYNPANAILLAVADGSAGDVILLEQQFPVCGLAQFGPIEVLSAVFDAIQTAVANGFVVVEAAGNGGVDLDQAACGTTFDRTVRDSGAIIVGAGLPPASGADRQRIGFSTFGSRVDLQGWGISVMTTGYGDFYRNPDDPTNPDFWYTDFFSGTSSASPIVAGAVANLQGVAFQQLRRPLTSWEIRRLLVQTGSPQLGNTAEQIGPRPDLRRAIAQLMEVTIEVTLDIKPRRFANNINPEREGTIAVAILTTDIFDATTVDPLSVKFGPSGATEAHGKGHIRDANGDGRPDLVLHFHIPDTGIRCGDTTVALTGQILGGQAIQGSDSIRTVHCNRKLAKDRFE
jgi:serine protease